MVPEFIMAEITLCRALDDLPEYDLKYQEELGAFACSLDAAGVEYSQQSIALHSVGASGWPSGNFSLSLLLGALPTLAGLAGAWIQARYGRKVKIKVGDVEAEASTVEEIKRLLELAAALPGRGNGT